MASVVLVAGAAACGTVSGCGGRAEATFDLIRAELRPDLPEGDRDKLYFESDCDSYGSASVSWTPGDGPSLTSRLLAEAGWTKLPPQVELGLDLGYGRIVGTREIRVYFIPSEGQFTATVRDN